ncbi:glutaredoxin domain-containing protein [Arthrobacter sp. GMC3]|uniref:glutaredoxin domain-containing protein n=1 Tax=Arthrobacter sp. GMC3 TaxID=2058894 RepID=UPI000CE3EED3|nr:glutaredoxin domain-containing protein [Arthrobacter sp. GMC3]
MTHPATAVYTKSNCPGCARTKKELDLRGVTYTEIDLEADPKALEYVQSLGHQAAPVVALEDGTSWASLRPDLINEHFGKRPAA